MIRTVYASEASLHPELFDSMFKHRKMQFSDRLNWPVRVDANGHEIDDYDQLNPLYVILENSDGQHGGSMRFLPTTGDTMINDQFTALTGGVTVRSPFIWECTRFCLAPNADRNASRKVLLATMEIGFYFGVQFFVGVFSKRMCRIYERIGWTPVIVGDGRLGEDTVCAGLWPVSSVARHQLLARVDEADHCDETLCVGSESWSIVSALEAA